VCAEAQCNPSWPYPGDAVAGAWWFGTMAQKKYWLTIEYENANPKQDDVPLWVGKATPEEVVFEIR
jgi:hypothetical protein